TRIATTTPHLTYATLFRSTTVGTRGAPTTGRAARRGRRTRGSEDRDALVLEGLHPPYTNNCSTVKRSSRCAPRSPPGPGRAPAQDRKSTRLNSSHVKISYA